MTVDTKCPRGSTRAVILDKNYEILSTGYNHLPKELSPCQCNSDNPDTKQRGSTTCLAVHAEIDALMKLGCDPKLPHVISVTRPPCLNCLKALLHTSIKVILVLNNDFPDRDNVQPIWEKAGRKYEVLTHNSMPY